jgi:predicted RecB family endonuclease
VVVNQLPPEAVEDAKRRLAAARALDMRNNLYGAASAYLAWSLDVMLGLDALESAVSLADGATIESLLTDHMPVAEADLKRLQTEVRQMVEGLERTAEPEPRAIDAVKNMTTALLLIEEALSAS